MCGLRPKTTDHLGVDRRGQITYPEKTVERLRLATILSADPAAIYDAWVSGKLHAEMTGSVATSEAKKGGAFTARDGYITGKHLVLERGKRIVESWRTKEFPNAAPDSTLEVRLSKVKKGTRIALLQSDIPDGQSEMYAEGWLEHYFDPMTRYFSAQEQSAPKKAAPKKAAPKKAAPKKAARKATKPSRAAAASKKKATPRKAPASARRKKTGRKRK
jgi:uncharacterized protein YndB with AHSA1/START domain